MQVMLTVTLTLTVPDDVIARMRKRKTSRVDVGEPWIAIRHPKPKPACAELLWCGYADAVCVIGRLGI